MECGTMRNKTLLEQALDLQKEHGWIREEDIRFLAEQTGRPEAEVYETLSFYSMILLKEPTPVRIEVCRGTSCYIAQGADLLEELQFLTGCRIGECSADNRYQIEYCECLGRCETAPNLIVNGKLYTSLTKDKLGSILKEVSR